MFHQVNHPFYMSYYVSMYLYYLLIFLFDNDKWSEVYSQGELSICSLYVGWGGGGGRV